MPIWAVFLAVGMSALVLLPIGTIEAITGTRIYVNVLSQMVIGLILPGDTIAVMAFKSVATNTVAQALILLSDLKLGHYLKIPPKAMVFAQLVGAIVGAVATTLTTMVVMATMGSLLGTSDWKAVSYTTFYNAGAIWGAVGPQRFFGIGSPYQGLLFGFLIGLLLPLVPWLLHRFYPSKIWPFINIPIILYVAGPGFYQNTIITPFLVNLFFNFYLFRYHSDWWKKYNYVLAAAINGSVALCVLIITVLRNFGVKAPAWAGNPTTHGHVQLDYYCFGYSWK